MKQDYLKKLKGLLDRYDMPETEKNDIVNDYEDMYDEWISHGMTEDEVEAKLGRPSSLIHDLTEGYHKIRTEAQRREAGKNKIVAVMPFIALVIFFVTGFGFDLWHVGWMAFLLIPLSAIFINARGTGRIMGMLPLLCVIAFISIGLISDVWHPTWVVFLLIPVGGILSGAKGMNIRQLLVSLSPFAAVGTYVYLVSIDLAHPGWLVFFIIPIMGVLNEKNKAKMVLWEFCLIGGVLGFLYLFYFNDLDIAYRPYYAFIPLACLVLYNLYDQTKEMDFAYKVILLIALVGYFLSGYYLDLWGYAWLLFLMIPMYAIYTGLSGSERLISLMPFISVILFFTLGWFFNLWAFAWLVFLLIPVVAIVKSE